MMRASVLTGVAVALLAMALATFAPAPAAGTSYYCPAFSLDGREYFRFEIRPLTRAGNYGLAAERFRPPCLKVPGVSLIPLSRLKGVHPGVAVGHRRNNSVVYVSFGSCPGLNGERLRHCLRRAAPPPITRR